MGFFNLYKPKEYKHKYIYYDPKKEATKEREKQRLKDEQAKQEGEYRPSIRRGTFREMAERNRKTRSEIGRQSNFRLLIIIAILFVIAYFLLFY